MSTPTACIVSRVMTIDLPWYAQWLEHHDRLGFTRFHLHYCDDAYLPPEKVLSFFPADKVTVTKLPKRLAEMDLLREIPRDLGAEYTLYIDSDEFLMLPEGRNVGEFLALHPGTEQFRFPWRMCVSDRPVDSSLADQSRATPSYRVGQHKSMTRSDLVSGVGDTHDPLLKRPLSSPPREAEGAFLLHFASRGLIDPYLKSREQGLAFNHGGDRDKLARLMDPSAAEIAVPDIPKRVLAALGEASCANRREAVPLDPAPAAGTDTELLGRLVTPGERVLFASRWEDLKRAGLFRGFTIGSRPKYEVWRHAEGLQTKRVPLRPM